MKDCFDTEIDLYKGGVLAGKRILIKIDSYKSDRLIRLFATIESNPDKIFLIQAEHPVFLIGQNFPDNCIIGSMCINQSMFEIDMEALRHIDCKYRFVYFIPVNDIVYTCDFNYINWAIVEGESERVKLMPFIKLIHTLKSNNIPLFVRNNYLQFFDEKLKEFPEWMKD